MGMYLVIAFIIFKIEKILKEKFITDIYHSQQIMFDSLYYLLDYKNLLKLW